MENGDTPSGVEGVAERIRGLRTALGLSQDDFAAALGVSRGYISNVENRKAEPSLSLLFDIERKYSGRASVHADIHSMLFGDTRHMPVVNPEALQRVGWMDHRALTAALRVADEQERKEAQPLPSHVKALFVRALMRGYVEVYQARKADGSAPDDAHRAAERHIEAIGLGNMGK